MKAKRKNTCFWSTEDGKPELHMNCGSKSEIMKDSKKVEGSSDNIKKVTFADQQKISKNGLKPLWGYAIHWKIICLLATLFFPTFLAAGLFQLLNRSRIWLFKIVERNLGVSRNYINGLCRLICTVIHQSPVSLMSTFQQVSACEIQVNIASTSNYFSQNHSFMILMIRGSRERTRKRWRWKYPCILMVASEKFERLSLISKVHRSELFWIQGSNLCYKFGRFLGIFF